MSQQVLKQGLGLDVSKDSIAACFSQQEPGRPFRILANKSFASSAPGLEKLHLWAERQRCPPAELHVSMEATGVYYEELAYFLHSRKYRVSVMLPNRTAAYSKSLEHKSKDDRIDAQKLAQLSLERLLPAWEPPGEAMLKIKRLCRERAELLAEKTSVSNRLHARNHAHKPEKSSIQRGKKSLKFLGKQVRETEKAIRDAIAADADIKRRIGHVCTIAGVGPLTAAIVVSEANGFALFRNKAQLVSYAGYDVVKDTSGTSLRNPERISKRGNAHIRKALYFPALVAVKRNPEMKKLYGGVFDRTKVKMKGYVAVQRKLLVLIYTLYTKGQDFDPLHQAGRTGAADGGKKNGQEPALPL
jgi:transposase